MTPRVLRLLVSLLLIGALAACSGGPSKSALQDAVQTRIQQDLGNAEKAAHALGGDSAVQLMHSLGAPEADSVRVENVTVLDSQSLQDGAYRMHLSYDTRTPNASHTTEQTYVLEPTDNGWKAIPSD